MECGVCGFKLKEAFIKGGFQYYECLDCRSIFAFDVPNSNSPLGGGAEEERRIGNALRIDRVKSLSGTLNILDFGCGHGFLVEDMKAAGINAIGYDKNNPDCNVFPDFKFDGITLIEVIEHLTPPFAEIAMISCALRPGGFLMIESSFRWPGMSIEDMRTWDYCDPAGGHCSILSPAGLNIICAKYGLSFDHTPDGRNVWIFKKL
jgi:Methyltransferase domain